MAALVTSHSRSTFGPSEQLEFQSLEATVRKYRAAVNKKKLSASQLQTLMTHSDTAASTLREIGRRISSINDPDLQRDFRILTRDLAGLRNRLKCMNWLVERPARHESSTLSSPSSSSSSSCSSSSSSSSSSSASSSRAVSIVRPTSSSLAHPLSQARLAPVAGVFAVRGLHEKIGSLLSITEIVKGRKVSRSWRAIFGQEMLKLQTQQKTHFPLADIRAIKKIRESAHVQRRAILQAFHSSPMLTTLDLRDCTRADAAEMAILLRSIVSSSDIYQFALGKAFPRLTTLDVSECPVETRAIVNAIVAGCPGLKTFNASGCDWIDGDKITLAPVGEVVPGLTALDLSDCHRVNDTTLQDITEGFPGLTVLYLFNCRGITAVGIQAIVKGCRHLEHLSLLGSTGIDPAAVRAIANGGLPKLRILQLGRCPGINEVTVRAIARGCQHLEVLDLSGCAWVNAASVRNIYMECPGLTCLGLVGCEGIDEIALAALRAELPELKIMT